MIKRSFMKAFGFLKSQRGVNLVEAMLAVSMTSLVFIAVMVIDISSRRFFKTAEERARVVADISFVMEHIQNHLRQAYTIGTLTSEYIEFWVDENGTPTDTTDDYKYEYTKNLTDIEFTSTEGIAGVPNTVVLSSEILFISFEKNTEENLIAITITGQRKVKGIQIAGSTAYEYVTLISTVIPRGKAAGADL